MAKLKMVDLTDTEIDSYCKKFKLERARYNKEKIKLEQKKDKDENRAYSEEQINRLILRASSKNTVAAVLCLHDDLIGHGLTPSNIYSMAAHDGGSKNLEALMYFIKNANEKNQTLENCFGLTLTAIVQLLSQSGGAKQLYQYTSKYLFDDDMQAILALLVDEQDNDGNIHAHEKTNEENKMMLFDDWFSDTEKFLSPTDNNSTALQTIGIFAPASSGCKRSQEDNSKRSPRRKFLKQTPEPTSCASIARRTYL